jgi:hypothetical protein
LAGRIARKVQEMSKGAWPGGAGGADFAQRFTTVSPSMASSGARSRRLQAGGRRENFRQRIARAVARSFTQSLGGKSEHCLDQPIDLIQVVGFGNKEQPRSCPACFSVRPRCEQYWYRWMLLREPLCEPKPI